MTQSLFFNCVVALTLTALGQAAHASNVSLPCAAPAIVKERLSSAYGETLHSVGMTKSKFRIEVFASETKGTWTITARKASGLSCVIASGEGFDVMSRQVAVLSD